MHTFSKLIRRLELALCQGSVAGRFPETCLRLQMRLHRRFPWCMRPASIYNDADYHLKPEADKDDVYLCALTREQIAHILIALERLPILPNASPNIEFLAGAFTLVLESDLEDDVVHGVCL